MGGEFDTRGLVDDWNKLPQSNVMPKSYYIDRIKADMENWKEFWRKTIFRVDITSEICHQSGCQASPRGRAYDSTSAKSIEIPFYFKSHKKWVSLVRRSLNHHESYPAVIGEKQEISDQLPQWRMPSVYSICYKIFLWRFCYFVQNNIYNWILDLMCFLVYFISFQIFLGGCILGDISGSTYVSFVDVIQLIKVKQKA